MEMAEGTSSQRRPHERALLCVDPAGRVRFWSLEAEEVLRRTRRDAIGRPFMDLVEVLPGDPTAADVLVAAFAHGSAHLAIRTPAGGPKTSPTTVLLLRRIEPSDPGGAAEVAVSSFFAPQSKGQALRGIQAQEDMGPLLRNVFESVTGHAIVATSLDGRIVAWNEGARHMYGYDAWEVLGRAHLGLIHPPEQVKAGFLVRLLADVRVARRFDGETVHVSKDGRHFHVRITVTLRNDATGVPSGYVLVAEDVTEARRAQEQLRESFSYVRSLFEASLDPLVTVSEEGEILDLNEAMTEATGLPRHALLGTRFASHFEEPGHVEETLREALRAGKLRDRLFVLRAASGASMEVLLNASVLQAAEGSRPGLLAAVRDVTQRRRLEREARAQQEALLRNERMSALGGLVAGVAHEINNPLTYISGNIELVLLDLQEHQQDGKAPIEASLLEAQLRTALKGTERVAKIAKALRAVARAAPVQQERVDVVSVADSLSVLMAAGVPDHVEVRFDLPSAPLIVMGDQGALHQALLNLVKNAIEAVGERPGVVTVRCQRQGSRARLEVRDDGPGMSDVVRSKLFSPFFTTKGTGTGLGLSIVHSIVTSHGGQITVESEPGRGTAFLINLPLAREQRPGQLGERLP